jgi:molecular chaperone DnaJ
LSERDYREKDYYRVLGVAKDASKEQIAKAYRRLALQLHPDASPGVPTGEERFKEVSEAHTVLSDPGKRKEYDRVRARAGTGVSRGDTAGAPSGGPRVHFGSSGFARGGHIDDFSDVFDLRDPDADLFVRGDPSVGGQSREGPYSRGRDLGVAVTLSSTEALHGVSVTLRIPEQGTCPTCNGSGVRPVSGVGYCPFCDGAGLVVRGWGLLGFAEVCPACAGRGRYTLVACGPCRGSGWLVRAREIRIRIPATVRHGDRIRLPRRGGPSSGGEPPGDLYVTVYIHPG